MWLKEILEELKRLDKKVVVILISVVVFQTISYYFTSRLFFRVNFSSLFDYSTLLPFLEYIYWLIGDFICFFLLPFLIIRFLFKEKLNIYGCSVFNLHFDRKFFICLSIVLIILSWIISSIEPFTYLHPYLFQAKIKWSIFIVYELLMLIYIFSWEFVWRGYMLFGLEEKFGWYAIFVQTIPFVILHNGKPAIETFSSILGGIVLGILALKTRTFLYGVFIHFGLMFCIDLFSTLRFRTNEFGIGVNSFFNLFAK